MVTVGLRFWKRVQFSPPPPIFTIGIPADGLLVSRTSVSVTAHGPGRVGEAFIGRDADATQTRLADPTRRLPIVQRLGALRRPFFGHLGGPGWGSFQ